MGEEGGGEGGRRRGRRGERTSGEVRERRERGSICHVKYEVKLQPC